MIRAKAEGIERELSELRRQQGEIVEMSLRNMFEMSTMVAREREAMVMAAKCEEKVELYEKVLAELQTSKR